MSTHLNGSAPDPAGVPTMNFQYRKKPIVIEAVRHWDDPSKAEPCEPNWLSIARLKGIVSMNAISELSIRTLEGVMTVSDGDWIIRGVNGEIYPCKPDIFAKSYDKVES